MNEDDAVFTESSATGLLQCLRMLAEEAASLRLLRTLSALQEAIRTCVTEHGDAGEEEAFDAAEELAAMPSLAVH